MVRSVEAVYSSICSVVFFLLSSAYFAYGWLMQVGIDQGYMPIQPIHYSHKIHSGDNQIDCQYCHSSARVSKHSGIPSLNVCMNCHENIAEYDGEEDLEKGYTKDFYTNEIKKLYKAVMKDINKKNIGMFKLLNNVGNRYKKSHLLRYEQDHKRQGNTQGLCTDLAYRDPEEEGKCIRP